MSAETTYNQIPYRALPISQTHPERMAVTAALLGVPYPDLAACRVLEIGCAEGTNLISMALGMPDSEFVGIDLSPRQIGDGNQIVQRIGVSNVDLQAMDLMQINQEEFGKFDYIIAHGIFSWVPEKVRNRILEICRDQLNDHGLAYISYNALPGWYMARGLRELMCYHTRHIDSASERLASARRLLKTLTDQLTASNEAYERYLFYAAERLLDRRDGYVYHEYLETENNAYHFAAFIKLLAEYGLNYVGDVEIDEMDRAEPRTQLERLFEEGANNWVDLQQLKDMIDGTRFRRSVVCKSCQPCRPIDPSRVQSLLLASSAQRQGTNEKGETKFVSQTGKGLETASEFVTATLGILSAAWPDRLTFEQLFTHVMEKSDENPDEIRGALQQITLRCLPSAIIQLHAMTLSSGRATDERPRISPLALLDLEEGRKEVSSLFHYIVEIDPMSEVVYPMMDGENTVEDILQQLVAQALMGRLTIEKDGSPIRDESELATLLRPALKKEIERAAALGLLMKVPPRSGSDGE